ncbi:MAG: transposase [Prevotellaceae bacterium]|nr:transposase [Prevotellaceae bacterium]
MNISHTYAINNFPVTACLNIRIARNRILKDKVCRGYCVSKRYYFYGFKVHVVVTADGIPVEYTFIAGSTHDPDGFKQLPLNFPEYSEILADSAYSDYSMEKCLMIMVFACMLRERESPGVLTINTWNILSLCKENGSKPLSAILPNCSLNPFMPLLLTGF